MNEKLSEIYKSAQSLEHFVENYCLRKDPKHGHVPFKLNEFQKKYLELKKEHSNLCIEADRQIGSTTIFAVDILHQVLFDSPKRFIIITPKLESGKNFIRTFKFLYENTASFLKLNKIRVDTKDHIIFENGSSLKAICESNILGGSCSESADTIYLDQVGYFENKFDYSWTAIKPVSKNFVFCTTTEDSRQMNKLFEDRKKDNDFYYFEYKNKRE